LQGQILNGTSAITGAQNQSFMQPMSRDNDG
jgi:hypothetical protein